MRASAIRWLLGSIALLSMSVGAVAAEPLQLHARQRVENEAAGGTDVVQEQLAWDPAKTAVVICDMWDDHHCKGAARRVAEMAPRMNQVVHAARDRGVLIIHCPSGCMDKYGGTPMRKLAQQAPPVKTEIPLQRWCHLDPESEAALPIDDSDGGCDCWPRCPTGRAWTRQNEAIDIVDGDAITDSAEAYYLMRQRGIENVIVMGVHTNMCVLGRPFSIRQMVYQGQNVVLMRDMTDTMYNSRSAPFVPHTRGTDLVIEHIEKFWCPTITSTDFTGQPAFVFAEATQPHVVFVIGEREYRTDESLPAFARQHLEPRGIRCTFVHADAEDGNRFPGIEALKAADLLFLSVRRRALPIEQLDVVRQHVAAGKPVVGIRTASHAFDTRGNRPEGHAEWPEFDPQVLGGNYHGHHGNGPQTTLRRDSNAADHPILSGVSPDSFTSSGSLYKVSPLEKTATPLVVGSIPDQPSEPVAWTNTAGDSRVFYTSLGHIGDFQSPDFNRLLTNAVFWALDQPRNEAVQ